MDREGCAELMCQHWPIPRLAIRAVSLQEPLAAEALQIVTSGKREDTGATLQNNVNIACG